MSALLKLFRTHPQHIAIVLDEYGGTTGLVTLEDPLEEIVGEVGDLFDHESEVQPLSDGSSLIDGLMPINDLNERFNLNISFPHYDTVAGFVLGRLERFAQVCDTVIADGVRLRVEAMDGLRIARPSLDLPIETSSRPPAEPVGSTGEE